MVTQVKSTVLPPKHIGRKGTLTFSCSGSEPSFFFSLSHSLCVKCLQWTKSSAGSRRSQLDGLSLNQNLSLQTNISQSVRCSSHINSVQCQGLHPPLETHLETFLHGSNGTAPLAKQQGIHGHDCLFFSELIPLEHRTILYLLY